jgi:hypothetical protein
MTEYVVEAILGEKRVKRGSRKVVLYKVKWEGYDEPSWEPLSNLKNCKEKLETYKASLGQPSDSATEAQNQDEATRVVSESVLAEDMSSMSGSDVQREYVPDEVSTDETVGERGVAGELALVQSVVSESGVNESVSGELALVLTS